MSDLDRMFAPFTPEERCRKFPGRRRRRGATLGEAVVPVPTDAPPAPDQHPTLGAPTQRWVYELPDGGLVGYICRFDVAVSGGERGKEYRPLTYVKGEGGACRWCWQAFPTPKPLYRAPELCARPDDAVLVCEGEKAADAAARLFPECVATTPPQGAMSPKKADWSLLAGRVVVISPDADDPGSRFATEVAKLVREIGAAEVYLLPPDRLGARTVSEGILIESEPRPVPEGWDLADAEAEGWTAELVRSLSEAIGPLWEPLRAAPDHPDCEGPWSVSGDSGRGAGSAGSSITTRREVLPEGFRRAADGLYHRRKRRNEPDQWVWLCTPLWVVALARNAEGRGWGRLLEFEDREGRRKTWCMPMSLLAGDGAAVRQELLDQGLVLAPGPQARQALDTLINMSNPNEFAHSVDRIGWHQVASSAAFVLPREVIGDATDEPLVYQGPRLDHDPFSVKQSLSDWQRSVAELCVGNSRLVLAVSAGFAGALLAIVGVESGGFHFVGKSSSGKSTALRVAGSVWGGGPFGFASSWRSTTNGLEALAAAHCDALLCLDELSEIDAQDAGKAAYLLANGVGKARAAVGGEAREPQRWRVLFLSAGEIGLGDKLSEDGRPRPLRAGQAVRLLDIPADAGAGLGLFENLHGFADADQFARALQGASAANYGQPAREFIRAVSDDLERTKEKAREFMDQFSRDLAPNGADGQVTRASHRFALVAAAGELATQLGIVPWPEGQASKAAERCFRDWLQLRGGPRAAEDLVAIERVRGFLESHGESRFPIIGASEADEPSPDARPTINRAGFRKRVENGLFDYLILSEVWKSEVCKQLNPTTVTKALLERGLLVPDRNGKGQRPERLPGMGNSVRVYRVSWKIFEDSDDE